MNVLTALAICTILNSALPAGPAANDGWIVLSDDFTAFQPPTGKWYIAGGAKMNPKFERRLVGEPGRGTLINGKIGVTDNLITRQQWGDVEVSLEFHDSPRLELGREAARRIRNPDLRQLEGGQAHGRQIAAAFIRGRN